MPLKLCILASGSSGNCTFVASETTAILIDAGLSAKEVSTRLEKIGSTITLIRAVCVSHEHSDHIAGLRTLHERHAIPIYANDGTIQGLRGNKDLTGLTWTKFHTGSSFMIGDLEIAPFAVPHDAMEPVGFTVTSGGHAVGVVTDIGTATTLVRDRLRGCSAVVIEANHDEQMLLESQRPWHLKQRILGRQGHLSNARAAQLAADIAGPRLQRIFLAHLSGECNRQDVAWRTVRDALGKAGHGHIRIDMTFPDNVSEVWLGE